MTQTSIPCETKPLQKQEILSPTEEEENRSLYDMWNNATWHHKEDVNTEQFENKPMPSVQTRADRIVKRPHKKDMIYY